MTDYFTKIKHLVDSLGVVGSPISDAEHMQILLAGVNTEYDFVVNVFPIMPKAFTLQDVQTLLTNQERRITKSHTSSKVDLQQFMANVVANSDSKAGLQRIVANFATNLGKVQITSWKTGNRDGNHEIHRDCDAFHENYNRGCGGRGKFYCTASQTTCQLCGQYGHHVNTYYFHFDHTY